MKDDSVADQNSPFSVALQKARKDTQIIQCVPIPERCQHNPSVKLQHSYGDGH